MNRDVTPPHSDEAEQSVLGSLLLDNSTLGDLSTLEASHFYRTEHRVLFELIRGMCLASKVADVLTVSEAGGSPLSYLNELAQSVFNPAHAGRYAEIVVERWIERELLRCAQETTDDAYRLGDPVEKVDRAMSRLTKLTGQRKAQESVSMDVALGAFLDRLQAEADGKTEVISTGLRDLDRLLAGGLRKGELIVLGGRPKMGKTALTLQLSRNISRGHHVLMLSQEMPVNELVTRNAAALGSVNLAVLRQPDAMNDDAWSRVSEAVEAMRPLTMLLDGQRGLKLLDVRRKVMDAKRKSGCDVVIIDYLQLMAGDGDNRNQELDRISNGLKIMAGEFDVAVILLSQMVREADKRHGPPVMTDLRDSGAIEAAADIIALLYREFAHPLGEKGENWKHHAQLEVIQRNGSPGTVNLWFSGEFQQFKDWGGSPPMRASAGRGGSRVSNTGLG